MSLPDNFLDRLVRRLEKIERSILDVQNKSVRSEITGAFIRRTVAELEDPAATWYNGMVAFATDGRKSGEGAGLGTGQPVYYDAASALWLVFRDDTQVLD